MTQEEKQLLLRDLCARLPYGVNVFVQYEYKPFYGTLYNVYLKNEIINVSNMHKLYIDRIAYGGFFLEQDNIRPYLRPMSSMTEEERNEYRNIDNRSYSCPMDYAHIPASDRIDWLNKKMFDYRGLIEKNLALEAPDNMY